MRAVVLGGGIGGMAAALLLADRGVAVTLIEAGRQLGAGWRSVPTESGLADLGIRVPRESGDARADALLFGGGIAWHRIGPRAAEGHVVAGRLNADTPCPDARALPAALLAEARAEMLVRAFIPDPGATAAHLGERLECMFGPTLMEHLLRPACRALLGAEPEALAPRAAEARLPARVVIADRGETEQLRDIGELAHRLAHPRAMDAPGGDARAYLYPRQGGIGGWVAALEAALARAGVEIRTGTRIAGLKRAGARVAGAWLEEGGALECDALVLAAAPRAVSALPIAPETTLPVHARLLTFEGAAPPPLDWIVSYDPGTPFMRLGFPDRLEGRAPSRWRIMAEMRVREGEAASSVALVHALAGLGLVPAPARLVADASVGTGRFAVETTAAAQDRAAALRELRGLANFHVLRSAAGGHALAGEIIADAARLVDAVTAPARAAA